MRFIPRKPCPECGELFTPVKRYDGNGEQKTCSNRCKYRRQSRERRGIAPVAATAAKRAYAQKALETAVGERFGVLTEREVAIFNLGREAGYEVGYNVAYHGGFPRRRMGGKVA